MCCESLVTLRKASGESLSVSSVPSLHALGSSLGFELPLLNVVSVYICTMELISIVENICEVNPQMYALFSPYLKKLKQKDGDKVDDRD